MHQCLLGSGYLLIIKRIINIKELIIPASRPPRPGELAYTFAKVGLGCCFNSIGMMSEIDTIQYISRISGLVKCFQLTGPARPFYFSFIGLVKSKIGVVGQLLGDGAKSLLIER